MINFFNAKKENETIFLLSITRITDSYFKISFIRDFKMSNQNYKGYFLDNKIVNNDFLFNNFSEEDFNKWYEVDVDYYGDILCLHYKKWKVNL